MKIIKDSGTKHWAFLQEVECGMCRSVFKAETEDDFRDFHGGLTTYVWMTCPCCDTEQKVFKKWNVKLNAPNSETIHIQSGNQYYGAADDLDMSIPLSWCKTTEKK